MLFITHHKDFVSGNSATRQRTCQILGGSLVTITSETENAALRSEFVRFRNETRKRNRTLYTMTLFVRRSNSVSHHFGEHMKLCCSHFGCEFSSVQ